jgi:hypothetical protein
LNPAWQKLLVWKNTPTSTIGYQGCTVTVSGGYYAFMHS